MVCECRDVHMHDKSACHDLCTAAWDSFYVAFAYDQSAACREHLASAFSPRWRGQVFADGGPELIVFPLFHFWRCQLAITLWVSTARMHISVSAFSTAHGPLGRRHLHCCSVTGYLSQQIDKRQSSLRGHPYG